MNTMKKYIAYLKDNPKGYWFKRKLYGWGWTPVTWQGWLVILGFVAALIVIAVHNKYQLAAGHPLHFIVEIVIAVVVLLIICQNTGEKLKWQWGVSKKDF